MKIGATLSATGPQASLGIPERNTVSLLPAEIGGAKVEYVVLDDASDPTRAVSNSHKLISENKVDLIIGSSTTPNTMAMLDTVAAGATPVITLASSARLIEPMDDKRRWVFKTPHSDSLMAEGIARHAAAQGVKKLAFIGFNNALGETFWVEVEKAAKKHGIELVGKESFAPTDTSAVAQTLKLVGAAPDAVVVGASGTPAAMPARRCASAATRQDLFQPRRGQQRLPARLRRGLRGRLGAGGAGDGGRPAARQPSGQGQRPGLRRQVRGRPWRGQRVPVRRLHLGRGAVAATGRARGAEGGQAGHARIPRGAARRAGKCENLPTATGVVNMSPADHNGLDERALVMATVAGGKWRVQ